MCLAVHFDAQLFKHVKDQVADPGIKSDADSSVHSSSAEERSSGGKRTRKDTHSGRGAADAERDNSPVFSWRHVLDAVRSNPGTNVKVSP
jgi:hypothetical protein